MPPPKESDDALQKWRINADKTMFVLKKITIEEEPPLISSGDKEGSSNQDNSPWKTHSQKKTSEDPQPQK